MSEFDGTHRHLDDDEVERAALVALDGLGDSLTSFDCEECDARVADYGRCLGFARLLTRDTRAPFGTPAVDAVRMIRRRTYRRRALGEIATLLTNTPLRTRG